MKEPYRKGVANRPASSLAEAVARLPSKRRLRHQWSSKREKRYLVPFLPNETWQETKEDQPLSSSQKTLGIVDVHSGSEESSLEGTPYKSW